MLKHVSFRRILFWTIILVILLLNLLSRSSTSSNRPTPGPVIINEVLAANLSGLPDEDGDASDWIELYNQADQPINLAGWSLTDDPDQPEKWSFPEITLGSHQYLLVFASGKDRKPTQPGAALHTNFKLNQAGEFLGLYNIFTGRFADIVTPTGDGQGLPEQFDDVAYGRYHLASAEPAYGYLTVPTPGQANDETTVWVGLVAPVQFSPARGFYTAPLTVTLATTTPGATIRYTVDGSAPTAAHGSVYTTPVPVTNTTFLRAAAFKPDFRPAPAETHTYIFPAGVLNQPPDPPGFPRTWGGYKGTPVTADYEMDPEVVNDPRYRDTIEAALTSLPTLSIVTDMSSFHDLYANPRRKGQAWERPVSVELIDPQGRQPGFQINAGLRMHGELGREEYMLKHPFRLLFRSDYGAPKLRYPLFPGSPVEEFDTLILRSGVNRSYAGYPKREDEIRLTTYTRDEWLRASQIAMSGFGARGIFVQLYLNGLYWGLYNLVERPDEAFMAAYFGGTEADWQVVDQEETLSTPSERFKTLHHLAQAGHLAEPEKYTTIQTYLDVPHFIDYLILNWYAGNLDWGFNNWFAGVPASTGPIRYFVWDGERTWYEGAEIYMEFDEYLGQANLVKPLFTALMENPDFRMELADRLYHHLDHGELADAAAQARWLSLNRQVELAIIAESARWGDTRFEQPLTQADWVKARDDVTAQMEGNAAKLLALARGMGYYPSVDPPVFNQPGGPISPGFAVKMELPGAVPPQGQPAIYYTLDGSDPRSPVTGNLAPTARLYQAPLVLTMTTTIKARALAGTAAHDTGPVWSALNKASFTAAELKPGVAITEIMYNPPAGEAGEFIELLNVGDSELSLAGMTFEGGIRYTFPPTLPALPPGERVVLAHDPEALAGRYPGILVTGPYEGKLANSGENITLRDAAGHLLVSITYDDENGWPLSPDGQGDSLTLDDPGANPENPRSWRASTYPNGSPGTAELTP